ncbi:hypothetical protein NPIL_518571 [Nephila pilipes]|uniref:Uncharacterized protein n=1 Tax=Nephila pilipes TaxID=299642 RepID=A0A8X6NPH8_NEPPI|nr:hypothetical protein NPIL_518571 [Nephila pilipes]
MIHKSHVKLDFSIRIQFNLRMGFLTLEITEGKRRGRNRRRCDLILILEWFGELKSTLPAMLPLEHLYLLEEDIFVELLFQGSSIGSLSGSYEEILLD